MDLKIAAPRIQGYLEEDSQGNLTGALGALALSNLRNIFKNVTFIMAELEGDGGLGDGNQSTNGLYSAFIRNEAEMFVFPLDYGTVPDFLEPTAPVAAIDGVASHAPTLNVKSRNFLSAIQVYSTGTLLLLSLTVLVCGITIAIIHKQKGLFWSCAQIAQCLLNQPNFGKRMLFVSQMLSVFWLITAFMTMEIYEQGMNTEMVAPDYSAVIDSINDLDQHKSYRPVFVQGEFIREQFKRSSDPIRKRIWNRGNRHVLVLNPMDIVNAGRLDDVHIANRDGAISSTKYFCGQSAEKENNRRYLIATKGFGVANMAFYFRANLEIQKKEYLKKRSLTGSEGGFVEHMLKKATSFIALLSPKATPACICYSKKELYEDVETFNSIQLVNIATFFGLFTLLCTVSLMAFKYEMREPEA